MTNQPITIIAYDNAQQAFTQYIGKKIEVVIYDEITIQGILSSVTDDWFSNCGKGDVFADAITSIKLA